MRQGDRPCMADPFRRRGAMPHETPVAPQRRLKPHAPRRSALHGRSVPQARGAEPDKTGDRPRFFIARTPVSDTGFGATVSLKPVSDTGFVVFCGIISGCF